MEQALSAAGIEVVSVTTDDDGDGRLDIPCGEPISCNGATRIYFPRQTGPYKASWPMLRWLLREVPGFDIVHVHALFSFAPVAAAWVARRARVPYVVRPLGVLNRYGMVERRSRLKALSVALLEGRLLRDAAAVHFTAEQEKAEAETLGVPMRSQVVPLGIEPIPTVSDAMFVAAHPGLGARRLLFMSRIDPKKNIETLLRALAVIRPSTPGVCLIVCGDGDAGYVTMLKALSAELGLEGSVHWTGHVGGEMKSSAFAAAELFVLPSFSENFGIAAAEALSAGLPCILGEGVALADRVQQAGAGLSVAPTVDAVAAAMLALLNDPDARARAGQHARALAMTEYSQAAMGLGLTRMYAAITKNGRSHP